MQTNQEQNNDQTNQSSWFSRVSSIFSPITSGVRNIATSIGQAARRAADYFNPLSSYEPPEEEEEESRGSQPAPTKEPLKRIPTGKARIREISINERLGTTHPFLGRSLETEVDLYQEVDFELESQSGLRSIIQSFSLRARARPGMQDEGEQIPTRTFDEANWNQIRTAIEDTIEPIGREYNIRAKVMIYTQHCTTQGLDFIIDSVSEKYPGTNIDQIFDNRDTIVDDLVEEIKSYIASNIMDEFPDDDEAEGDDDSSANFLGLSALKVTFHSEVLVTGQSHFKIPPSHLSPKSIYNIPNEDSDCLYHAILLCLAKHNWDDIVNRLGIKSHHDDYKRLWDRNMEIRKGIITRMFMRLYRITRDHTIDDIEKILNSARNDDSPLVAIELWEHRGFHEGVKLKGIQSVRRSRIHSKGEIRIDLIRVEEFEWEGDNSGEDNRVHICIIKNIESILASNNSRKTPVVLLRCCRRVVSIKSLRELPNVIPHECTKDDIDNNQKSQHRYPIRSDHIAPRISQNPQARPRDMKMFNSQKAIQQTPMVCYYDFETYQHRGPVEAKNVNFKAVPYEMSYMFACRPDEEWFRENILNPLGVESIGYIRGDDPKQIISNFFAMLIRVQSRFQRIYIKSVPNPRLSQEFISSMVEKYSKVKDLSCRFCGFSRAVSDDKFESQFLKESIDELSIPERRFFDGHKLIFEHDHFIKDDKESFRGLACVSCNAKMRIDTDITLLAFNAMRFDNHIISEYFDPELILECLGEDRKLVFDIDELLEYTRRKLEESKTDKALKGFLRKFIEKYRLNHLIKYSSKREEVELFLRKLDPSDDKFDNNLLRSVSTRVLSERDNILCKSGNQFIGIRFINKFQFKDARLFFGPGQSLAKVVESYMSSLRQSYKGQSDYFILSREMSDAIKYIADKYPSLDVEDIISILTSKGIFPYDLITSLDVLEEPMDFPSIDNFSKCSQEDYDFYRGIYEKAGMRTIGEWSRLYCIIDTILLGAAFENVRKISIESTELDPASFYGIPSLGQACFLKSRLEKIKFTDRDYNILRRKYSDVDQFNEFVRKMPYAFSLRNDHEYQYIQRSIYGGVSTVLESRHEKSDEDSVLLSIDINSLYPSVMTRKVPKAPMNQGCDCGHDESAKILRSKVRDSSGKKRDEIRKEITKLKHKDDCSFITSIIRLDMDDEEDQRDALERLVTSEEGEYLFEVEISHPENLDYTIDFYAGYLPESHEEYYVNLWKDLKKDIEDNHDGNYEKFLSKCPMLVERLMITKDMLSDTNLSYLPKTKSGELIYKPQEKLCLTMNLIENYHCFSQYLKFLLRYGYIFKIKSYMQFICDDIYREFIEETYKNRKYFRDIEKNDLKQNLEKLKMNSLYGKSIQNDSRYSVTRDISTTLSEYDDKLIIKRQSSIWHRDTTILNDHTVMTKMKKKLVDITSTPHTGSSILASAKVRLLESASELSRYIPGDKLKFILTDTDSLYLKVPRDFIDRLPMSIIEDLFDTRNIIKAKEDEILTHRREIPEINGGKLGCFDLEGFYDEIVAIKSKVYACAPYGTKDRYTFKSKGVSISKLGSTIEDTEGNELEIDGKHHESLIDIYKRSIYEPEYKTKIKSDYFRESNMGIYHMNISKSFINGLNDKSYMTDPVNCLPYGYYVGTT